MRGKTQHGGLRCGWHGLSVVKLSHNDPVDRDPSATVSTNVGEEMQRGALLPAAGGALSPSFAPVILSVTCPRAGCEQHAPSEAAGAELHHGRLLAGRPRGGIARCSSAAENLPATCRFHSMFKSRLQIAAEALVIAALSASAAAQDSQASIGTLTDLEAALLACWVPPPMEQSRPGMQITVLMSFKRNGELFAEPRIVFQSGEASEAERSAYRIAVAQALKRCASLPFTEAFGNAVAGQPFTMTFVDDREQPPDPSRAGSRPGE